MTALMVAVAADLTVAAAAAEALGHPAWHKKFFTKEITNEMTILFLLFR